MNQDCERVISGVQRAAELLEDGISNAIIVISIDRHSGGCLLWNCGDPEIYDQVLEALRQAMPLRMNHSDDDDPETVNDGA